MEKYESYKDSGIEWIGKVPSKWHISRIGQDCTLTVPQRDKPKDLEGPIPWLRIEDFDGKYVFESKSGQGVTKETINEMNLKVYPVGTVLTACSCSMGKTAIVQKPLITNQTFIGLTSLGKIYPDFLYFFILASTQYLNSIASGAIQSYLSRDEFSKIRIPYPEFEEQVQIAKYLDYKTAQIDKLITDKQRLIELLNEERTAMIHQAVTKGLDPNVPMKDSSIEWLGEIPNHWEVWKLSHAFNKIGGGTTPESGNPIYHENGTINWLNTGDLNDGVLNETTKKVTLKALEDYSALKVFPPYSVVIAMYGATIGKTSLVNCEITTNQACCVFYGSDIILNEFLFNWFLSNKSNIVNLSKGGGQPNVSMEILKNLRVPCPGKIEQELIVDFVQYENLRIEKLISNVYQEIELLKEYKTALISEAVTGKVDVREERIGDSSEFVLETAML